MVAAGLVLVAAGGCGSSGKPSGGTAAAGETVPNRPPLTKTSPSQRPQLATILVSTSARRPDGTIATQYTCKGTNTSPSITWGGVSSKAKEVVVLVRTLSLGSLKTNWILAGINPHRTHIDANTVPPEAIVGANSEGSTHYSVCPPKKPALVVVAVLGLDHKLGLKPGFDQRQVALLIGTPGVEWGSITAATSKSAETFH